jgi:hypothetical protein
MKLRCKRLLITWEKSVSPRQRQASLELLEFGLRSHSVALPVFGVPVLLTGHVLDVEKIVCFV